MPTPEQWLATLHARLDARRPVVDLCERYYDGHHRLAFATSRFRETFGGLFGAFADNWCQLVVDASVERLTIDGFRFGDDESSDTEAWDIWQRNELDQQSMFGHTESVKCGEAYGLVAPDEDGDALITVEHPSQCIVAYAPGMRRRRQAALKEWLEDDEHLRANVYLPDVVVNLWEFGSQEELTTHLRERLTGHLDEEAIQMIIEAVVEEAGGMMRSSTTSLH